MTSVEEDRLFTAIENILKTQEKMLEIAKNLKDRIEHLEKQDTWERTMSNLQ